MIMLIFAIIALVLALIDYVAPGRNLTPLACASLAIGHIVSWAGSL